MSSCGLKANGVPALLYGLESLAAGIGWIFLRCPQKGKLVNSAFGSNVPQLVEMMLNELDIERATRDPNAAPTARQYFELDELTPLERTSADDLAKVEQHNDRVEAEMSQRKRDEYLTGVTDTITANANDMGVTIQMPHVMSRDLLKRLSDAADKCGLVVKDKKNIRILAEHTDVIGFGCTSPMPAHLLDHIMDREVFAVCWKIADNNAESKKDVEGAIFAHFSYNFYRYSTACSARTACHSLAMSLFLHAPVQPTFSWTNMISIYFSTFQ